MSQHLSGCHIAITGTLSKVRAAIIADIQAAGGTFSSTVGGSTTHLVAANPYLDTVKFQKAKALGVEIVGEDFLDSGKVQQVFEAKDAIARAENDADVVTYQYEEAPGFWLDYDSAAHGIVEAAFQDWLRDPETPYRPIKSGFFIYRVDFNDYTQKNMQVEPYKVRKIRRVVGGVPQEEQPPTPQKKKAAPKRAAAKKATKKRGRAASDDEEDEEEDAKPQVPAPKSKKAAAKKGKAKGGAKSGAGVFDGVTFAISGKLSEPRAHFEKLIVSNGGTVAKSITKAVTHVITSDVDSGSAKITKARANGVNILSEEFLTDAIEDGEIPQVLDAYTIE